MFEAYKEYIIAASFLTGSIIVGYLVEKLVLLRIKAVARKTKWKGDDIIVSSVKGVILFTSIILGAYLALRYVPENKKIEDIAGKAIFILMTFTITLLISRLTVTGSIRTQWFRHGSSNSPVIFTWH